jgi:hypothetical protein
VIGADGALIERRRQSGGRIVLTLLSPSDLCLSLFRSTRWMNEIMRHAQEAPTVFRVIDLQAARRARERDSSGSRTGASGSAGGKAIDRPGHEMSA